MLELSPIQPRRKLCGLPPLAAAIVRPPYRTPVCRERDRQTISLSPAGNDLPEVAAGLLVTKCLRQILKRECSIEDRPQIIGIKRANEILLLLPTAHDQAL